MFMASFEQDHFEPIMSWCGDIDHDCIFVSMGCSDFIHVWFIPCFQQRTGSGREAFYIGMHLDSTISLLDYSEVPWRFKYSGPLPTMSWGHHNHQLVTLCYWDAWTCTPGSQWLLSAPHGLAMTPTTHLITSLGESSLASYLLICWKQYYQHSDRSGHM